MAGKTSKVSAKGLTTVPIKIRREFDIQEGSELEWTIVDGNIMVTKVRDPEEILKGRFDNLSYDDAEVVTDELFESEATT